MKIVVIWTIKHDTSSPKFYELLINIELKGDMPRILIIYKTTQRCVSMRWLESNNNYFLHTSASKKNISFTNNSCQIIFTLFTIGMKRHTIALVTTFLWLWQISPVPNIPQKLKFTRFSPPMLMKSHYIIFYTDLYMQNSLILESWMMMSVLNWLPWTSNKGKTWLFS